MGDTSKRAKAAKTRKLVYSIPVAGAMAGLSREGSYAAAKRGEIPTIAFGRLRKVPAAAWERKLQGGE
jgi:hypothetical protein